MSDIAVLQKLEDRFVRYCKVDTQSAEDSESKPSTACQLDLARMLVEELSALGVADVRLTDYGAVLGTVPANISHPVPSVAFVAHMDTAPCYHASGVRPIVHRNWDGSDIVLPDNPAMVISPKAEPYLARKKGEDIVTASGTTLLGADDKAGIAIIMGLIDALNADPAIMHGEIRIVFTPDEEIGLGVDARLPADIATDVAYTLDGGDAGELIYETFSADRAVVTITGVSIHTGDAKGKLVNSQFLAAKLINLLPQCRLTPETTDGRDGFIFLDSTRGNAAETVLDFNLRDFELDGLAEQGRLLQDACVLVQRMEPRSKITCVIRPQYRNMRYWLEKDMRPVDVIREAYTECGLTLIEQPSRGGTDGSVLTEMGLPTPNIFCGMQNVHGPLEWVSLQDMEKAVSVCVKVAEVWGRGK